MCEIITSKCEIGYLVTLIINIIKILVPVVLIIMGMLDFAKAVTKNNQDEMVKARNTFITRCIAAGITFFVVSIVQLAVSIVAKATSEQDNNSNIWKCVEKLINNKESC